MVLDGPCSNTMNPTKDATYTFLAMFLQEVGTIFKDEYLFLGGDEVTSAPCPLPCPALPCSALPCSALLVASDTRTRVRRGSFISRRLAWCALTCIHGAGERRVLVGEPLRRCVDEGP